MKAGRTFLVPSKRKEERHETSERLYIPSGKRLTFFVMISLRKMTCVIEARGPPWGTLERPCRGGGG